MKRTIAKTLACSAIFSFILMSFECGEDRYYKNEYLINNDTDTYVELRLTKRDKTKPSDTLVIDASSSVVFKSFENGTDPKFEKLAYILCNTTPLCCLLGTTPVQPFGMIILATCPTARITSST